jgi:hypothetical protein
MDRVLTLFIRAWIGLAVAVNVVAMAGIMMVADGLWAGWQEIASIYSPFNVWNVVMELVLFSPAIVAYMWRERRRGNQLGA